MAKIYDSYRKDEPMGKVQKPTNPDNGIWAELSAPFERESLAEEGMPVEKKGPQLAGVQWLQRAPKGPKPTHDLSISKTVIYVTAAAAKKIGSPQVVLGAGVLDGQPVLLLRPVEKGTPNSYMLSVISRSQNFRIGSPAMIERLLALGLQLGRYKLCKAKGGFIAKLVKEGR